MVRGRGGVSLFPLAILVVTGVFLWIANDYSRTSRIFPMAAGMFVAVLTCAEILLSLRRTTPGDTEGTPSASASSAGPDAAPATVPELKSPAAATALSANRVRMLCFAASMLLFIPLVQKLGFIVATSGYLVGASLLLGYRRPRTLLVFTPVFVAALFFFFTHFLNVPLPGGVLGGILSR